MNGIIAHVIANARRARYAHKRIMNGVIAKDWGKI